MATPPAAAPASEVPVATPHNSSLYVGDLDREVTEAQLYELFSSVGPVASIRVCRDAVTRRSLGYAYVNYNSALDPSSADRALEQLNYSAVNTKNIRIMWSHRDPALRKSAVGNIFIKNLDKAVDNKGLHEVFSAFGNILSCKVAADKAGQSRGYGFVHFEEEESAQNAIKKMNGMLINDKVVFVGPFLKRTDRPSGKDAKYTNVYIKNLETSVTDEELMDMVKVFGEVTSVVVMKDEQGNSRGFGFVNFETAEAAGKAVEALHEKDIKGKKLWAGRAQKKSEREAMLKQRYDEVKAERVQKYQGMNLYVKNLSDDVDDAKLREVFNSYGTITSCKVMGDEKSKSRGFGFVCFTTHEDATRAVTEMNGHMMKGKPLYVSLAQRKDVRRAQIQQQRTSAIIARQPPGGPMPGMFPGGPGVMYPMVPGAMHQRPGPYMQQMMPRGGMGGGRGRGMGMMPQHAGGMMMGGPGMGPGGPMGRGGRGGRGRGEGRGEGRGGRGEKTEGEGRGGRGGRGRGRNSQRDAGAAGKEVIPITAPPAPPAAPAAPAPAAPAPPAPLATPPVPTAGVVPGAEPAQAPLTTAMLAAAPPEQQKQMLGERLFPQVQDLQPELAGKITGMLLEMDNSELLLLLESKEALTSKVDEAIQVLKQHNAIPESTQLVNADPAPAS